MRKFKIGDTVEIKSEGVLDGVAVFEEQSVAMPCGMKVTRKRALSYMAYEFLYDIDGMIQQVEAENLWPEGWK